MLSTINYLFRVSNVMGSETNTKFLFESTIYFTIKSIFSPLHNKGSVLLYFPINQLSSKVASKLS